MEPLLPEKSTSVDAPPAFDQPTNHKHSPQCDWSALASRIQNGDQAASDELYHRLHRGLRLVLIRRIGIEVAEDVLQDVFMHLLSAIMQGRIHKPESLPSYVLGIVNRTVAKQIQVLSNGRRREGCTADDGIPDRQTTPEGQLIEKEKVALMVEVLKEMKPLEQDVLRRFYLHGQSQEQICRELSMSATSFRLHKSRGKARLVGATPRAMRQGPVDLLKRAFARTA